MAAIEASARALNVDGFAELSRSVRSAGLLERRRIHYGIHIALNTAMYAAGVTAFVLIGDTWWQLLTALFLGIAFTQTAFLGHDAGHAQVFRTRWANDVLGYVYGNLLVGLSFGWWNRKHNAHHRNPNHEDLDPDVGAGVVVFTDKAARNQQNGFLRGFGRRQAVYFIPLLLLEGLNLHVASIQALKAGQVKRAGLEVALLGIHLVVYFGAVFLLLSPGIAVLFIAIQQGVFGLYMGASFAPNHKGMPIVTNSDGLGFFRYQVITARNVRGSKFVDYALGGLNYQIEHHLFPSMPRPNLRHAQPMIRAFCDRQQVPYTEAGLFSSYRTSLRSLHDLGAPLRRKSA